jgi:hypothetical protein
MSGVARAELHQMIDELPESELAVAHRLLQALRLIGLDPRQGALEMAPWDDEPTNPEEEAGLATAYAELARGEVISAEKTKRRLLT